MPEPILACWGIVTLLALAAGYNHRWHHARDRHPSSRLPRAQHRDAGELVSVSDSSRDPDGTRHPDA